MEIANYIQNRLPTKNQIDELVLEEAWTGKKQDVSHMKVFSNIVSVLIPKKKRQKSDIHRNWKGIFVSYNQDTTKQICALAPKTQQILLVSNPYIDKSEQGAKLLIKHALDLTHSLTTVTKKIGPTGEPKPRG